LSQDYLLQLGWTKVASQSPGGIMEFKRNGTQPSAKGPEEYFTGTAGIDPLFEADRVLKESKV